ncbi:MAG: DUF4013 domain-containing protein [Anaerolineae bacterium]|nr:DUF4013 domain-containing protein [Anaerolineae bacterium]
MIDLPRAIKYPFSGDGALVKTLIGGVLALFAAMLLPIFLLLGYQLRIIRDVLHERDDELPAWDNFGEDMLSGLIVFLGTLVYYLPAFILVGLGVSAGLSALADLNLVKVLLEDATWSIDRGKLSLAVIFFASAIIWMVLSAPLVMTGVARFAETGEFRAFINVSEAFSEAWRLRSQTGLLMLYLFVLQIMAHTVSAVASSVCLLPAYVQFIHFAVVAHLNGQWAVLLKTSRPVIRPIKPKSVR